MAARAQYEKEKAEMGSEQEEDLAVFDDEEEGPEAIDLVDGQPASKRQDEGKGWASEEDREESSGRSEQMPSSKRKRPRVDPFSEYDDLSVPQSTPQTTDAIKKAELSTPVQSPSVSNSSQGASASTSEDREGSKAAKKAKRKAKKL